jgi:hypothetical protein
LLVAGILSVMAGSSGAAELKPGQATMVTPAAAANSVVKSLTPPAPDLVVHLVMNTVGIVYPYQSFYVENIGTADSPPTTVQALCTAYKGNAVFGQCSEAGKVAIPALPAPKKPNDPASIYSPQIGWTPGGMPCDKWNDQTKQWAGVTKCVIVATVDPDHLVADSNKFNNTVTVTIPAH